MKYLFYSFLIFALILACANEKKPQAEITSVENDILNDKIDTPILVYTKYNLPLPVDFYRFIKSHESNVQMKNFLNPITNCEKYICNKKRGINFGIYASDLAYSVVSENKQQSIDYFNVTKELADALHIAKGYSLEVVERLNDNLQNNDSLHQIASKAYWNACNYLEANDEVNILPLIIAGGWIESIYIAVNSVDENNPPTQILKRLTDEKQSLENLIQYLLDVITDSNTFEINADIQELGTNFKELRAVYATVPNGEILTQSQFIQLKKEITKIRNFYTN